MICINLIRPKWFDIPLRWALNGEWTKWFHMREKVLGEKQ